jgi:hypothetical protein
MGYEPETAMWDIAVQWAGEGGKTTGQMIDDVRPETFFEFCFRRPGYFGKMPRLKAAYILAVYIAVTIYAPWVGAPFLPILPLFTWLSFKGYIR